MSRLVYFLIVKTLKTSFLIVKKNIYKQKEITFLQLYSETVMTQLPRLNSYYYLLQTAKTENIHFYFIFFFDHRASLGDLEPLGE